MTATLTWTSAGTRWLAVEERRRTPRVHLCVEAAFQSDSEVCTGFTLDLSEGGIFIASHALKAVGTLLALTFSLPGRHEITAAGIVRWIRDPYPWDEGAVPGMGIQLRGLSTADLFAIREFVERCAPPRGEPRRLTTASGKPGQSG